ncbi:glycosyltransferase family 4 protein [Patescibacteria group bacterium]|nr:glycosyltransferase family 4 protein [Patescibacteria group bacterium]MBU1613317.1 glycosyltransferase family 4 protein [Patescibacteria group bacterium]
MKQKKKILFVITQGVWGGAQRYVFDLATGLGAKDWEVFVAVGEPSGRRDLQEKLVACNAQRVTCNVKVVDLKYLVREISPWHDLLAVFELKKLYRDIKPDVVHLNSSKAGIIGSIAKLFTGYTLHVTRRAFHATLAYTVHGWVFNEPLPSWKITLYVWLEKMTAKLKDKIIVLSPQDFEAGKNAGIPEGKMVIVPLGIIMPEKILTKDEARGKIKALRDSSATFFSARNDNEGGSDGIASSPALRAPRNDIWVGAIANLYKTKGLDVLVEAIHRIPDQVRNDKRICCFIIGEGPERNSLENLIKEYNLQNVVHLVGCIENASELLPAFDLFMLPSRKEGLPYVILEAMSQNIPIISTNVGGIPSLVEDKKTGLLVDPERPDLLSETILYALDSTEEVARFSTNSLSKISEYSIGAMVKKTVDSCYLQV